MPGTGTGQGTVAGYLALITGAGVNEKVTRIHRVGIHDGGPLGPLGIADLQHDGTADGTAVADPAQDPQLIALKGLAGTAPVPQTPAGQRCPDVLTGHPSKHETDTLTHRCQLRSPSSRIIAKRSSQSGAGTDGLFRADTRAERMSSMSGCRPVISWTWGTAWCRSMSHPGATAPPP